MAPKKPTKGKIDLYAEFDVSSDATTEIITKSFRKLALKFHPDRMPTASPEELKEATERFQQIALWYEILKNPDRRSIYDMTGIVDDRSASEMFGDRGDLSWAEYFDMIFNRVTTQAIDDFQTKYIGSAEELEDIKSAYSKCKGDIFKMMELVPFLEIDRVKTVFEKCRELVESGELPTFKGANKFNEKKFLKLQKEIELETKEAVKAKEELEKKKKNKDKEDNIQEQELDKEEESTSENSNPKKKSKKSKKSSETSVETLEDLKSQIMLSKKRRQDSFMANMEQKYGGGKKTKINISEPTDEEFEALQKKLFGNK